MYDNKFRGILIWSTLVYSKNNTFQFMGVINVVSEQLI